MQRPRPIITVEGNWSLEKLDHQEPSGFLLRNVGTSPAFDVEVSEIIGPLLRTAHYSEHLVTDRIPVIAEKPIYAFHRQLVPGTPLTEKAAPRFMLNAVQDGFSAQGEDGEWIIEHQLPFSVEYRGLDGRNFSTACLIRFSLGVNTMRAWIAPASSWLGTGVEQ